MHVSSNPAPLAPRPLALGHRQISQVLLWLLLLAVVVNGVAQLDAVVRGSLVNAVDLLFDDAYYYLGVAWNLAQGNGSKFTEPLQTNGYHPLWLLLLTALTFVFDLSKRGLFMATLMLVVVVKCAGIALLYRQQRDDTMRTAACIAVCVVFVKYPFVFSQGLETTLFIIFIPLLLALAKAPSWSRRRALAVGAAMSVVFLTRIDGLALDAAVLALAVVVLRIPVRSAALAAIPLAITVAVYLGVNFAVFDTPLPVSGQAKAIGSHFAGNLSTAFELLSVRWTIVMLALWAAVRFTIAPKLTAAWFELGCLALAVLASAFYYGALSGWPIWPWYLYPNAFLALYATMAGVAAVAALLRSVIRRSAKRSATTLAKGSLAVLCAAFAMTYVYRAVLDEHVVRSHVLAALFDRETRGGRSSFNQENVALIPWLLEHYPRGATLAMGDRAGGLGYWMPERYRMIQIEGLVADKPFLSALRNGTLDAALAEQHVDLYVTDRPRAFESAGVLGFVEPVQPLVTGGPLNMLCFRDADRLLAQDYVSQTGPVELRRVFDYSQRIACPALLVRDVQALRGKYAGLRSGSGF